MKTFVLEINEQPAAVFRATDVKAAVKWAKKKRGGGWWYIVRFRATTAGLREATIAEQAAWRARAVEAQLSSEKAYEFFATLTAGRRRALG